MIFGENGILQRAGQAKINTDEAQIREQIQLAYHTALTDGLGRITESLLISALDDEFGENKYNLDTSEDGKSWVVSKINVTENIPKPTDLATGGSGGENEEPQTPTASTVVFKNETTIVETPAVGNDVEIGDERFKVIKISTDGKKVTAMPYYNITLSTTHPVQITDGTEGSNKIKFSESQFWTGTEINIEPMSSSNVKQYINAYGTTLSNLGASNIEVTIGRNYKNAEDREKADRDVAYYVGNLSGQLNPSGKGYFWLGSAYKINAYRVVVTYADGSLSTADYWNTSTYGVRPIIIITLP